MSPLVEAVLGILLGIALAGLGLHRVLLWLDKGHPEWFRGRP